MFIFSKMQRLLARGEFRRVYNQGKRYVGKNLIIFYLKDLSSSPRLGITIAKKWGKAHERNRFKRVVREGFRTVYPNLSKGLVLNIHPKEGYRGCSRQEIELELKKLNDFCGKTQSKSTKSHRHH